MNVIPVQVKVPTAREWFSRDWRAQWVLKLVKHSHVLFCLCATSLVYITLDNDNSTDSTMSAEALCYTVVYEDTTETPSTQELRSALEKGSDEEKLDTLRRIIVATINGNPQVRIHALDLLRPIT